MEVTAADAPESWEVVDVEASMKRLMLSHAKDSAVYSSLRSNVSAPELCHNENSANCDAEKAGFVGLSEDNANEVDHFLREALQNPRERLSILRIEQDIEKFIQDPLRQQLEFQQLPTSYLRLAAHRVAQHYFLQSMVLLDNSLSDGSGSRIIVHKTSTDCQLPRIRLADIPVNIPLEDTGVVKVAIKQRPQKQSPSTGGGDANSVKDNHSKSVEERKEEYNRARARIFSSNTQGGSSSAKPEFEPKKADKLRLGSAGIPKVEEKSAHRGSDLSCGRGLFDSSTGSSSSARSSVEKESINRYRPSSRVAILRDRDVDRKDPDYDRSYDRYMQRFDPGFGFNSGLYPVQPMYASVVNYNTEFPQLGSSHRPHVSVEPPPPLPQHLPGPWASPPAPKGLGYGASETLMSAYVPNYINGRSATAIYLHSAQYPCHRPVMPFIHPHEYVHQICPQFQHQLHDAPLGLARPR